MTTLKAVCATTACTPSLAMHSSLSATCGGAGGWQAAGWFHGSLGAGWEAADLVDVLLLGLAGGRAAPDPHAGASLACIAGKGQQRVSGRAAESRHAKVSTPQRRQHTPSDLLCGCASPAQRTAAAVHAVGIVRCGRHRGTDSESTQASRTSHTVHAPTARPRAPSQPLASPCMRWPILAGSGSTAATTSRGVTVTPLTCMHSAQAGDRGGGVRRRCNYWGRPAAPRAHLSSLWPSQPLSCPPMAHLDGLLGREAQHLDGLEDVDEVRAEAELERHLQRQAGRQGRACEG